MIRARELLGARRRRNTRRPTPCGTCRRSPRVVGHCVSGYGDGRAAAAAVLEWAAGWAEWAGDPLEDGKLPPFGTGAYWVRWHAWQLAEHELQQRKLRASTQRPPRLAIVGTSVVYLPDDEASA